MTSRAFNILGALLVGYGGSEIIRNVTFGNALTPLVIAVVLCGAGIIMLFHYYSNELAIMRDNEVLIFDILIGLGVVMAAGMAWLWDVVI